MRKIDANHQLKLLEQSILKELASKANDKIAKANSRFIKGGEKVIIYGINAKVLREIIKKFKNEFKALSIEERLALANALVKAGKEESSHVAIELLVISKKDLLPQYVDYINEFMEHFQSWAITDDFVLNVMQPLLLTNKEFVLLMIDKWLSSENRWKRRAAMVLFTRKIGASGRFTDDIINKSKKLIRDEDDLVRKAVGWALKDGMRGSKNRIIDYVMELRALGVSSTIILYAIRDLKGEERNSILNISKE